MIAPVIETARLRLRPHRASDIEAFAALYASDRAAHVGGRKSVTAAWFDLAADAGNWALTGLGGWAVELKDGTLIGQVGYNQAPGGEPELGWMLFDGHEGRGYATEAATAARDYGFANGLNAAVSYVEAGNARSVRLAERLGAWLDAGAVAPFGPALVYRHLPEACA